MASIGAAKKGKEMRIKYAGRQKLKSGKYIHHVSYPYRPKKRVKIKRKGAKP